MEYQVPQFIEVEDKIFGPFTLKQFIYLAGGAGGCAVALIYLPFIFGILIAIPVAALAAALAFYKMNGKPFIDVLGAGASYFFGSKLYLWKRHEYVAPKTIAPKPVVMTPGVRRNAGPLTEGKLRDLAWSLDVNDPAHKN